jgi:hypothetical protein
MSPASCGVVSLPLLDRYSLRLDVELSVLYCMDFFRPKFPTLRLIAADLPISAQSRLSIAC